MTKDDMVLEELKAIRMLLERVVDALPVDDAPGRMPTAAPLQRSEAARQRALVLKEWLIGYGNSLGLQPHPEAHGVREHLDMIIGKGGDPVKVLLAAQEMGTQAWWKGKPYKPPGLRHFAERFESYYLDACERRGMAVNEAERKAAVEERRRTAMAAQRHMMGAMMGAGELAEAARYVVDSLAGRP